MSDNAKPDPAAKADATEKPAKAPKSEKSARPESAEGPGAEKGETAETAAAGAPASGPPLPVLLAVTAVALIGGAAAGDFLLAPRIVAASRAKPASPPAATQAAAPAENKPAEKKDEKSDKNKNAHEKPATYRMDNIIVNPAGSNGTRFLMASVAVEVQDKSLQAAMKERDAELRDAVISALERQSLELLLKQGARDSVRHEIETSIEGVMNVPVRVFLPQFVVQ
jgi:flagellar FliL protein